MKTIVSFFLVALAAAPLKADLIPISGFASVTAQGGVGVAPGSGTGVSYNQSDIDLLAVGSFSQAAAGEADGQVSSSLPQLPAHVDGSATQEIAIDATELSVKSQVKARSFINIGAPYVGMSASTEAKIDITFQVDALSTVVVTLNTQGLMHGPGGFFVGGVNLMQFSLIALDGGLNVGLGDFLVPPGHSGLSFWNGQYTGILGPGDYRLVHSGKVGAFGDPLGDSGDATFDLRLKVAAVPEGGSTLLLLLLAAGGIALRRRAAGSVEAA